MRRPLKNYLQECRDRAVLMVFEASDGHGSQFAAMKMVGEKLGVRTPETIRRWVRRAEVDNGDRRGTTSEEHAEIKRLKRENAELRRANEILKAASSFFAAEIDRPLTESSPSSTVKKTSVIA